MATTTMTATQPTKASPALKVKQLYTYPIKSLRGLALPSLPATPLGFALDRRFMLVSTAIDSKTGLYSNMHVSGFESMCLFTTHIPEEQKACPVNELVHFEVRYGKAHSFKDPEKGVSDEALLVPVAPDVKGLGLEEVKVRMHGSPTVGFDMGDLYNGWFSERFGFEVKLLYLGGSRRKVLGNVAPGVAARQRRGELGPYDGLKNRAEEDGGGGGGGWLGGLTAAIKSTVGNVSGAILGEGVGSGNAEDGVDQGIGFADVAPFLMVSATSYANAAARFKNADEVDITKFRPNIVLEGAEEAFDEDYWGELAFNLTSGSNEVDKVNLVLTQNCARCNSLNVDYQTGKVGEGEKGTLLKSLMKDRRVDPGSKWSPIFGRYGFLAGKGLSSENSEVVLNVGDEVKVARRNDSRTSWEWPDLGTYPKEVR